MPDREELAAAARELVPVLRERARKTEQLRRIPEETISDLQAAGLFKALQPARYGGYEADIATYFDIVMTLSAADGSVGWVYSVLSVQTWMVSLMATQTMEEIWGSDPSIIISSAFKCREGYIDKVTDGFQIVGRFAYSSGCHHGSWVVVGGVPRNAPEDGPLLYLVPRVDYEIDDNWHVMGLCGTGSCDVVVNARVPAHRVHNLVDIGSIVSDALVYRLPFLPVFAHAVTFPLVGMAQGALDDYLVIQKDRVRIFGGKVANEPTSQIRVSESAADLDTARLLLFRNLADMTARAAAGEKYPTELLARVDRDQVIAARYAITAVDRVFANAGARALSVDDPVQRAWRDVHAGAAHPTNLPETKLVPYGALAFGIQPTVP